MLYYCYLIFNSQTRDIHTGLIKTEIEPKSNHLEEE